MAQAEGPICGVESHVLVKSMGAVVGGLDPIMALWLAGWVTLNESLNLSVPPFPC